MVTNTVVITAGSTDFEVTDDAAVERISGWLRSSILLEHQVVSANPVQLITLKSFERLLVVCPDWEISEATLRLGKQQLAPEFQFGYSLSDNKDDTNDYLQVPKGEKLFLISPPCSPPPEFDYSRCEEAPNSFTLHRHPDQTHLPTGTLLPPSTLIDSKLGKITLERRGSIIPLRDSEEHISVETFKTALPPRSIFDDDI